ncbi:HTH_Tnp_Tc3_2 domain-containing protein [Trichonephila clavipes]|nr:HTH_Tnp_Tc3_2 domain-containing protein [Trichonephila clavipes]
MTSRKQMEDSERWRSMGRIEAGQPITDVALFFSVHHSVISSSWKQFQNHTDACPKSRSWSPKGYNPHERSIAIIANRNRRSTSTRVTSMVSASIGKAISPATLRRKLDMSGLYARVPQICVPLSVQSKGARLKWWQLECGTWQLDCVCLGQCHVY